MDNKHAQSIPADVLAQVNAKLSDIITLIKPYMVTLTPEERHSILKKGDKSDSFVSKTFEYTKTNPEFIPAFMNVADFEIDLNDSNNLVGSVSLATQICNTLDDTMMVAGSEAYYAALYYYSNVQQSAAVNIPGAKAIQEELKKRFVVKSAKLVTADAQK